MHPGTSQFESGSGSGVEVEHRPAFVLHVSQQAHGAATIAGLAGAEHGRRSCRSPLPLPCPDLQVLSWLATAKNVDIWPLLLDAYGIRVGTMSSLIPLCLAVQPVSRSSGREGGFFRERFLSLSFPECGVKMILFEYVQYSVVVKTARLKRVDPVRI
jgi:hypothetical protein